ncbi:hypothetical protein HKBW3S03_01150 [Candidatus Hakubella thermalkaliphila]|uniref:Uncharacterized protein n=3 Tax=Candidatus Hakubella thermalkaliphila TaxID=2754717 RepID=A0A6V8PCP9_9ACTN|nr:hypothetical protein [Candidatus Hakubella thermalkaliphila]GFP19645.1 hypothetical protein HKBW3S03_01150 [Candidatus Hakubella thermalkaliphila]GFP23670.1 hypothetical protein HKBW3S09_01135 [Candidatus Hakubella thermalkaliphila]GFP30027.1 hypothetical protein HKBW3S34_00947 [Candidatus Hakubella thermalkaliphila]GFP36631.1 hypothetical protein HKBW3S44_00312 [Candidatus Hakubella thermalkaliphila]
MSPLGVEWISNISGFEVYKELELSERMSFQIGQFYLGPVKYPLTPPKVLEIDEYDPVEEEKSTFRIASYNSNKLQQQIPIKSLNLRSEDRLYILQGKLRPVIILGYCDADWLYDPMTKGGIWEKLILCLPIFTFKARHSQDYVVKIQIFEIPNLFYIKPSNKGVTEESAARFELIQPIHKGDLQPLKNLNERPFKLSGDTLKVLWNHLCIFLTARPLFEELQKDLQAYAELIKEKIGWR